eukprot:CAMPEP_0174254716 /NCGR_PEP_ID=MMETSP0439-20130205/4043_1 /TAXON_ID=0 /ORGANISM="Stereomyxa ramosa, Strain Chinc5" /LENGTH=290 /DNA_ID=CAMNT_0015336475 /DNA_START=27 /DNA_END=899 /DNA_ORIENTATION=-
MADISSQLEAGKSFYDILNLEASASSVEIKRAYYKLALQYHPDRSISDDKELATRNFQDLTKIYETLSDPKKKELYDTEGIIDEEGLTENRDWEEYWRALYRKVTTEDIMDFGKKYKGSEMEIEDLLEAYKQTEGDMDKIIERVPLSENKDITRFIKILDKKIDEEELEEFEAYTKFKEDKKKPTKKAKRAKRKRKTKAEKEAEEAAELAKTLGIKTEPIVDGEASLREMILGKKTRPQERFDSLIANIEAKYSQPKKRGRPRKKPREEPSEEDFQKARQRLEARRKARK